MTPAANQKVENMKAQTLKRLTPQITASKLTPQEVFDQQIETGRKAAKVWAEEYADLWHLKVARTERGIPLTRDSETFLAALKFAKVRKYELDLYFWLGFVEQAREEAARILKALKVK